MPNTLRFFVYLGAFICFLLAATGSELGGWGRPGFAARLSFLPMGLALLVLPPLWDTAEQVF